MSICIVLSTLTLLYVLLLEGSHSQRDLLEVRYHFTSCDKQGRYGPSYSECRENYRQTNSSIFQNDVLLSDFNTTNGIVYAGAQRFRVPISGLYNVTVAGAAGARGICNIEQGYGVKRRVQMELSSNLELLILVGQRGWNYCDAVPSSTPCENRPMDISSAVECRAVWTAHLNSISNDTNSSADVVGGGGGGGASMIRAYTQLGFDSEPAVIAAGGGGSSAILNYSVVDLIGINMEGMSQAEEYRAFINAKFSEGNRLFLGEFNSSSGGRGGQYNGENRASSDGGLLRDSVNFAIGGLDCMLGNDSSGGFGGGGGACAGGGGGGGYTGGVIFGDGEIFPGGGGFSMVGDPFGTSFKLINLVGDSLNDELGGYVEIIHADCECIFKCELFLDSDQFECTCPGETQLAPDRSDCYTDVSEAIIEGPTFMITSATSGIVFYYEEFRFENRVFLYSIDFQVTVDPLQPVDHDQPETIYERCIVVFVGRNREAVAYSNVHRRSVQVLNSLALPHQTVGEEEPFLDVPVEVYAAVIVSAGNCSIVNMTVYMNISIRDRALDDFVVVNSSVLSEVVDELQERFTTERLIMTTTTPATSNQTSIGIGLGVLAAAVLFLGTAVAIFLLHKRRKFCLKKQVREAATSLNSTYKVVLRDINQDPSFSTNGDYTSYKKS